MDAQAKAPYQYGAPSHTYRRQHTSPLTLPPSVPRIVVLPLLILVTLLPIAHAASADPLTLNLPHVPTTCETLNLTWSGGTAPYTLLIAQARSSVPLLSYSALTNTSISWTANACGGADVSLTLTDAGGDESIVSFGVQRGTDGSCLSAGQRAVAGCVLSVSVSASATKTGTAGASGTAGAGGGNGKGSQRAVVVGVVVGVGVFVVFLAVCAYVRQRRRRGAGVLGPGSRPYFVRHDRDHRARRRDTLLEMPAPAYSDSANTTHDSERRQGHTPDSSPPLSRASHEQGRPLMPVPETIQMAQLPHGRGVEPELLPTPFVSTYESSTTSTTTASSERHAREPTGASHSEGAGHDAAPGGGEVHSGGTGADEPPPPYTLTA